MSTVNSARSPADAVVSYRDLAEDIVDVVIEADLNTVIRWASPTITDLLGWDARDVVGMTAADLVHPDDLPHIAQLAEALSSTGGRVGTARCRMRRADGDYRAMRMRGRGMLDPHGAVVGHLITLQDTSERDAVLQALTTLTEGNRVLARGLDEAQLLSEMCAVTVSAGGYLFAWFGARRDDEARSVEPMAWAGPDASYLDGIQISWGDNPLGHGPTGTCIRTGTTQVVNSLSSSPGFAPWREAAEQHGFQSVIALPVLVAGQTVGALVVHSHDPHAFDTTEMNFLEVLATDLGVGLERLRAVHNLAGEQDRLRGMMRGLLEPVVLLDPLRDADGRIVDLVYTEFSDAALAFNHLTREQMLGARLSELFPGQQADGSLAAYINTIESGEPIVMDDVEYFHEVRQESLRMDIRAARSGTGIAIAFRDVTERYVANERLRLSEEQYRLLAENSSDVVFLGDDHFHISWASASTEATLGYTVDEIIGRSAIELFHPDDLERIHEVVAEGIPEGDGARLRYRLRLKDGSYRWFDTSATATTTAEGKPRYIVACRDVDEQMSAEIALAERERLYRLLADNSSDVVMIGDAYFNVTWVSTAAEGLLGLAPEDLAGTNAARYIHPDDLARLEAELAGRTDGLALVRYRWVRPDGTARWVEARGVPLPDPTRDDLYIISIRDVDEQVQAEISLAEREHLYRLLAENSSDVVLLADDTFTVHWASPSCTSLLGVSPEDLTGTSATQYFHPDDMPRIVAAAQEAAGGRFRVTYRWRRPDHDYVWLESNAAPVSEPGANAQFVVSIRDVNAQVEAELALAEREARFRLLAENATDVVWQVSPDGTIEWSSPSVASVLGRRPGEVVGRPLAELVHPDDLLPGSPSRDAVMTGKASRGEIRLLGADGHSRWMAYTIRPLPRSQGLARIASFRDIEEEHRARRDLEFARGHDPLTGLPTRQALTAILDRTLEELATDRFVAVMCVGVDGLARVNDALTHYAGDLLITTIAARLAATVGPHASLGRGTGDELIVILPGLADPGDAGELADEILAAIRQPVPALKDLLLPTVSIGIATSPVGGSSGRLLADSAVALRQSKDAGRDRFTFVDPELAVRLQGRLALERRIRESLSDGEFHAWLQPIVSFADRKVCGYEALARWVGEGEPLLPGDFIPVAERSNLIRDLDLAILDQALADLVSLPPEMFVSVNASAVSLHSPEYAERAVGLLTAHGADPARLHLEVTETTILEIDENVRSAIHRLADMGVRWYVDDFGTGFSSISHLRNLPITGLKLDLSFTRGIREGDLTSVHLARGLFGLAEGLGLHTIAEGIETQVEAMVLASQGWEGGQGWLYGRPQPFVPQ